MVMEERNSELLKYLGQLDARHQETPVGGSNNNISKFGKQDSGGGSHQFPVQMQMLKMGRVRLDGDGCITLSNVLHSFTAGVNEEQAWALCYQITKAGQLVLSRAEDRDHVLLVMDTDQVKLHQDGSVHRNTFLRTDDDGKGPPRVQSSDECKVISKLVHVIYEALEYGMEENVERVLSPELEGFLEKMIYADESEERFPSDDEGIGDSDVDPYDDHLTRSFNFLALLKVCRERLGSSSSGGMSSSGSLSSLGVNGNNKNSAADNHYKAVVRALVAETLELSTFLEKVAQGTVQMKAPRCSSRSSGSGRNDCNSAEEPGLEGLHFTVWARLWVQVIRDLRNGVKLKKVEDFDCIGRGGPPIEWELTPYEILMDDIRSRRYKLKQVMVDGELPQRVKRDAHELILEFIRGRPPLRKAADRVLGPAPEKPLPPIEALMESIRTQNPQNLRPTRTIVKSSIRKESLRHRLPRRQSSNEMTSDRSSASGRSISSPAPVKSSDTPDVNSSSSTTSSTASHHHNHNRIPSSTTMTSNGIVSTSDDLNSSLQSQSTPQRRLIKADLDALYGNDKDDDDSDDDVYVAKDSDGTCYYGHICPDHTQSEPVTPWKTRTDLPRDHNSSNIDNRRRHTICNPDRTEEHGAHMITFPLEYTNNSLNVYNSLNGPSVSPILARRRTQNLPRSMSKSALQEEFFQSNQWQTAMDCLSLNLEEVVHIRNVLTKAELESLPVDCSTKEDVEKGKVCFLCLKSRFSLFGPWGNSCKLCKRMVCAKCCSKMRIPTEHFANIPVANLTQLLSPTREEDSPTQTPGKSPSPIHPLGSGSGNVVNRRKNSVGSAPTSPALSRKSDDSGQRSISPGMMESEEMRDRISPDGNNGPYSLPTVSSISLSLQALKRRSFGRIKKPEVDKTDRLMGQLMMVCHDCKAMVLQIIRTSRVNKGQHIRTNMTLDLPPLHQLA